MLENIVQAAKGIDYRVLDELNSTECENLAQFKSYLNSFEALAQHWELIQASKYQHRL